MALLWPRHGIMVCWIKKGGKTLFFIKGQHHPKSVVNSGPKVGPELNKKLIFMLYFIHGFHCQMENNKNPKGRRAKRAAAPLGRRRRRRFVVFHLAVETMNKKPHGNLFFIKVRPDCWPRIGNRLWVALALNKK